MQSSMVKTKLNDKKHSGENRNEINHSFVGQEKVVELLVGNWVPINAADADGWTALHFAVAKGNF